jgi:hypothetical protein
MHKIEFGQAYCQHLVKRILRKFISYLSGLYFILYAFGSLYIFSGNSKPKMKSEFGKNGRIVMGYYLAHDHGQTNQSVHDAQWALAAAVA